MISEVKRRRAELEALCRRLGVRRLEIFGSAATGGHQSHSEDLDFLVEFVSPTSPGYADRYFELLESLQTLFNQPVDLVVSSAITNPYFRESVEKTRTVLYAH